MVGTYFRRKIRRQGYKGSIPSERADEAINASWDLLLVSKQCGSYFPVVSLPCNSNNDEYITQGIELSSIITPERNI